MLTGVLRWPSSLKNIFELWPQMTPSTKLWPGVTPECSFLSQGNPKHADCCHIFSHTCNFKAFLSSISKLPHPLFGVIWSKELTQWPLRLPKACHCWIMMPWPLLDALQFQCHFKCVRMGQCMFKSVFSTFSLHALPECSFQTKIFWEERKKTGAYLSLPLP